jgi:hypothetical protein
MIETLGDLGDFIGGIGVLVTLVYLVRQLRTNTTSVRTATYQAAVDLMSNLASRLAHDPEMYEIMLRGAKDPSSLTEFKQRRFDLLVLSMVRAYENLHFQYRQGAIDDEEWEGWEARIRSTFQTPGYKEWWSEHNLAFCPPFRCFIESESDMQLPKSMLD